MTVSPVSGSVGPFGTTLTVSVVPGSMPNGTYTGHFTVTYTAPGQSPAPLTGTVSLTINVPPRTLSVNPASLSFAYDIGGARPNAQSIALSSNFGGSSFNVSASTIDGGNWIGISPVSGSIPATISISVDPSGLQPGTYSGNLTVTSPNTTNSPQTVPITLIVGSQILFTYAIGADPPSQQCFVLKSSTSGQAFTASTSGERWLSISPTSGATPRSVCVVIDPAGLQSVTYQSTVTFSVGLTIRVVLTVVQGTTFSASPSSLTFVLPMGGSLPPTQTFIVKSQLPSSGIAVAASVAVDTGGDWLAVSPASSSTPATFTVSLKPVSLPPGSYTANVILTSHGVANSPLKVPVTLTVPNVRLSAAPAILAFSYDAGAPLPAAQNVAVSTRGPDGTSFPMAITANVSVNQGGNWASLNNQAATTPGNIAVSVNPSGLAVGTYTATVSVSSPTVSNSPLLVPVVLTVSKPKLLVQPSSVTFNYQIGDSFPLAQVVTLSSSGAAVDYSVSIPQAANWLAVDNRSARTAGSMTLSVIRGSLPVGTYSTVVTISSTAAASTYNLGVTFVIRNKPSLISTPRALSFTYQINSSAPSSQTLSVSGDNTDYTVSSSTNSGGWLSVNGLGGTTPDSFQVSVSPTGMTVGRYSGTVTFTSSDALNSPLSVPVVLNVVSVSTLSVTPSSLNFDAQAGSVSNPVQNVTLIGSGAKIDFTTTSPPWVVVSSGGGTSAVLQTTTAKYTNDPVQLPVSVDPTGLAPGTYNGVITLNPNNSSTPANIAVTLTVHENRLRISQVADGGAWKTTIVIANTDNEPAPFEIDFYQADGNRLSVPLKGIGSVSQYSDIIPIGGSRTLETLGESADLVQGWAEVIAGKGISGNATFRQHLSDSIDAEGVVPVNSGTGRHFLLPFDNTQGFVTSVAVLDPQGVPTTLSIAFRDENGLPISSESIFLNGNSRVAFTLPSQFSRTAGRRGIAEFTSSASVVGALGLLSNPRGAFTSIEPIDLDSLPAAGTSGFISQIADGPDWQTTMILINAGSADAPFSLQFTQPNGTPWNLAVAGAAAGAEYSDSIPAGGSRIIQTSGNSANLVQGWGQITTAGSIAGTVIFRQHLSSTRDSDGAVPVQLNSLQRFVLPFDNTTGFITAMAIANEDPAQSAIISVTLRDENGQILDNQTLNIPASGRMAFLLPAQFQRTIGIRGVAEFSTPGVNLSTLGLRVNPLGSFTSIDPLAK